MKLKSIVGIILALILIVTLILNFAGKISFGPALAVIGSIWLIVKIARAKDRSRNQEEWLSLCSFIWRTSHEEKEIFCCYLFNSHLDWLCCNWPVLCWKDQFRDDTCSKRHIAVHSVRTSVDHIPAPKKVIVIMR